MITHKVSVTVAKPSAQVFKFIGTDYFANHPRWDHKVIKEDLLSNKPVAVGTRGQETRRDGKGTASYAFQVTEFKEGSQMAFKATGEHARLSTSYTVTPLDGTQTQLGVDFAMQMTGFMRLFERFMAAGVKNEVDTTLAKIKKLIESQP